MKNYKNKSLSDTVSTIGSMLLFLMFAGCMLMIIAVAAGTYSRISSNFDKTFGASASLRYISNKIKSANCVEIIENGRGLLLKNSGMTDIIYFGDGGLYEKSVSADIIPEPSGGSRIFELGDMKVTEDGALYKICVAFEGGDYSTFVRVCPQGLE